MNTSQAFDLTALCPDLDTVTERVEQVLMEEATSKCQLSESDIPLACTVIQEMGKERYKQLSVFAREFAEISGATFGWRRGPYGDSCNNSHVISLGNFLWEELLALLPTSRDKLTQPVIVHDTFNIQLWFFMKEKAPDKRTQRLCIDPLSTVISTNDCYLINSDWFSCWKRWVNSCENEVARLHPIDNEALVDIWRVRRSLIPHFTVTCLIERDFIRLLSWYTLSKRSMAIYVKGSELDLYPLTIRSCVYGATCSNHRIVCITKGKPVRELVDKIKFCFGIGSNIETRVFFYFNKSKFYHFKDTSMSSAQLFHGQIVQIQVIGRDGTWEERDDVISDVYSIFI